MWAEWTPPTQVTSTEDQDHHQQSAEQEVERGDQVRLLDLTERARRGVGRTVTSRVPSAGRSRSSDFRELHHPGLIDWQTGDRDRDDRPVVAHDHHAVSATGPSERMVDHTSMSPRATDDHATWVVQRLVYRGGFPEEQQLHRSARERPRAR